jgi:hypothetical protein
MKPYFNDLLVPTVVYASSFRQSISTRPMIRDKIRATGMRSDTKFVLDSLKWQTNPPMGDKTVQAMLEILGD